ncbi:MAG: response regulator [Desulfobacteraceae bacterium]|nr:MAG: response regulator [Desulfobacteraceae bacterium]
MNGLKEILVADDDFGMRDMLSQVLSMKGFNVTLAKDGEDSLDRMRDRRFDLLITDVSMPRLTGLQVLKKMKEEGRSERVIVMTGDPIRHSELGSDLQPVFTLLQKPFPIRSFLDVVNSALSRSAGQGSGEVSEVRQGCSIN